MLAITVPGAVIPDVVMVNVVPFMGVISVITAVVAPAPPVRATSVPVKELIVMGSLNTTWNTGFTFVGFGPETDKVTVGP
ncbi:MAG: hypothetical protein WDN75_10715 [Bacteroidota bacterium]